MGGSPEMPIEQWRERNLGWKCATCSQLVTRIEDGWVEWLAFDQEDRTTLTGLHLVHRRDSSPRREGCEYDRRTEFSKSSSIVEGLPLSRFVGPDGLTLLLSMIAQETKSVDEIIELTKRVHIPGYEQARELFPKAIETGLLSPCIGYGFYLQSEIQALLRWAAGSH
jgi:hypothetical protein